MITLKATTPAVEKNRPYYAIMSVSEEGTYYLVNGWNKNRSFWLKKIDHRTVFKRPQDATRSLNHLLSIMPDYKGDELSLMRVVFEG